MGEWLAWRLYRVWIGRVYAGDLFVSFLFWPGERARGRGLNRFEFLRMQKKLVLDLIFEFHILGNRYVG